jgi:hypothetical protein
MGPGSAAHRHSASKARVNALMALRRVPGTALVSAKETGPPDDLTGRFHSD